MFYWCAHGLLFILSKIFFPIRVRGLNNLPQTGGYLIASNHLSNLDPMILGLASGKKLSYIAKASLFRNKFFAIILRKVGAFPIKRKTSDFRAIRESLRRLKNGSRIVVFPEGTRRGVPGAKQAQAGVGLIATKANVPVVPAHIRGSEAALPPGAKFFKGVRKRVDVAFGKPIYFTKEDPYGEISNKIIRDIAGL